MERGAKAVLLILNLGTACGDFGPITAVEVRAFGTLAYGSISSSLPGTPRERSTPHQRAVQANIPPARELPSPAQTADCRGNIFSSNSSVEVLRGGEGDPAFVTTGIFMHGASSGARCSNPRRAMSAHDLVHSRLDMSAQMLEHRAILLRPSRLEQKMVGRKAACEWGALPLYDSAFAGPAGLLKTQGALHHLKVIARAARSTHFRWSATAVSMTAVPGGPVPADSSLQYPEASRRERLCTVAAGAAAAALALVLDSKSLAASWLRVVACSMASFILGSLASSVLLSELRIRPYLRTEEQAAYSDSKFVGAGAVTAHYLEAVPATGKAVMTLLCLHGFGASCASYRLVLQPLADALQARVIAVDMPGFGLTSRPSRVRDFCPQQMVSEMLKSLGLDQGEGKPLVVMGHSLGGLVAAKYLITTDNSSVPRSSVAAAVLVAPLVVHSGASVQAGASSRAADAAALAAPTRNVWSAVVKAAGGVVGVLLKHAVQGLVKVLMPVFALMLRKLVYTPDFWSQALGSTYHDRGNMVPEIVAGYRRASWVSGWDAGLLNFVRFRMTAGRSLYAMLKNVYANSFGSAPPAPSTTMALGNTAKPLLFIHGASDRTIPCANSRFVSGLLAGQAEYVEVDACGHCPMEERPEEFVGTVTSYLKRTLTPSLWS
jgi:pimeloyl-ACP methyl ester carboxylesterase